MLELIYTSAPQGLLPGRSGFSTVAMTAGMPSNLIVPLENLSGYNFTYQDNQLLPELNPVCCYYVKYRYGNQQMLIAGRVAPNGLDYSKRNNKIAHHIKLESPDELRGNSGAAGLFDSIGELSGDSTRICGGVFVHDFQHSPCELAARNLPTAPQQPPAPALTWQEYTGNCGTAAFIAHRFRTAPQQPLYVKFDLHTPVETLLDLTAEVCRLLAPHEKSDFTFSTYFHSANAAAECFLRFIPEFSPHLSNLRRFHSGSLIELNVPLAPERLQECDDSDLMILAQTGTLPQAAATLQTASIAPPIIVPAVDDDAPPPPPPPEKIKLKIPKSDAPSPPETVVPRRVGNLPPPRRQPMVIVGLVICILLLVLAVVLLLIPDNSSRFDTQEKTDYQETNATESSTAAENAQPESAPQTNRQQPDQQPQQQENPPVKESQQPAPNAEKKTFTKSPAMQPLQLSGSESWELYKQIRLNKSPLPRTIKLPATLKNTRQIDIKASGDIVADKNNTTIKLPNPYSKNHSIELTLTDTESTPQLHISGNWSEGVKYIDSIYFQESNGKVTFWSGNLNNYLQSIPKGKVEDIHRGSQDHKLIYKPDDSVKLLLGNEVIVKIGISPDSILEEIKLFDAIDKYNRAYEQFKQSDEELKQLKRSLPKNIPQSKISIPSPSALKKKIDELKTQAGKITFDADEDDDKKDKKEKQEKVQKQLKQLESDTLMLIAPFFNEKNPKVLKRRAKELVDLGDKIKASLPENISKEFKTDVEKYSQAVKKQLDTLETIIKYKEVEEQQENFRDDLRKSRRELNKLLSKVLPDNSKPDFLKDNNNFVKIDDNQLNKLCKIITDNIKLEYAKKDRSQ